MPDFDFRAPTTSRLALVVAVVTLAALASACGASNPNFCEGPACDEIDAAVVIDARPVLCTATGPDPSCPAATPVCVSGACTGLCDADGDCAGRPTAEAECHMPSGACVTCDESDVQAPITTDEDECPGANNAVCDSVTHTCRGCEDHAECFSGVCDAGRCAPPAEVIYMSANGVDGGNNCDNPAAGMGCLTLNFAIGKITVTRKYILMAPSATPYAARNNTDRADFNGDTAHVIGYGATVNRSGAGLILDVHAGSDVTIEGLTVSAGGGSGGTGILVNDSRLELFRATVRDNGGMGIDASSNSRLRILRSTLTNNDAGGILLNTGEFAIINSIITKNGDPGATNFGGVSLLSTATTNSLEFNTIAENSATSGTADQVICNNAALTARNNIISFLPSTTGRPRISGNCTHTYSLFSPDSATAGTGNMTITDPAMFMFTADFHIGTGSVAAGAAQSTNLAGDTLVDIDGHARMLNGTTVDVGADEIP